MKLHRYFPLGKATGQAFCNRAPETKKLSNNLNRSVHTYIVAPRRYGKSSLSEKVLTEIDLPWTEIDFHMAVSEKDIEHLIIKGVADLIGKSIGRLDKFTHIIKTTLKHLKPKLDISAGPATLELEISGESTPAESISEAILLLDKLLQKKGKQAAFLFDEFQEVGNIAKGRGVEGAIRHAAQSTQNLAIIFSGSNPHILKNMFENDRRPLYKLCKKLTLQRLSPVHYRTHLNKAAKKAWNTEISESVFELIMDLTERHPYYVNALCDEVWVECSSAPKPKQIKECWSFVIEGEKSDLIKDFLSLSENQRKVVRQIVNFSGKDLFSKEALHQMDIQSSSLNTAILALLERDFIEKNDDKSYRLVVPVYRQLLRYE